MEAKFLVPLSVQATGYWMVQWMLKDTGSANEVLSTPGCILAKFSCLKKTGCMDICWGGNVRLNALILCNIEAAPIWY